MRKRLKRKEYGVRKVRDKFRNPWRAPNTQNPHAPLRPPDQSAGLKYLSQGFQILLNVVCLSQNTGQLFKKHNPWKFVFWRQLCEQLMSSKAKRISFFPSKIWRIWVSGIPGDICDWLIQKCYPGIVGILFSVTKRMRVDIVVHNCQTLGQLHQLWNMIPSCPHSP